MAKKKKEPLTIDVLEHILVPKHTKLTKKESKKLLEDMDITIKNLIKIKSGDPAIAKLKAEPGDIIKIERDNPLVGKTLFYRVVVSE